VSRLALVSTCQLLIHKNAALYIPFSLYSGSTGVPKTVSRLALVSACQRLIHKNAALYCIPFSLYSGSTGVPKTVSRLALVSACQLLIRKDENAALYCIPFSLYSGNNGVPKTVSRLALVSACQLLIRKDENAALHLFQPFVAEALLYACKVTPGTIKIKASAVVKFGLGSQSVPETVLVLLKAKKNNVEKNLTCRMSLLSIFVQLLPIMII
jgi:hypothetical protein